MEASPENKSTFINSQNMNPTTAYSNLQSDDPIIRGPLEEQRPHSKKRFLIIFCSLSLVLVSLIIPITYQHLHSPHQSELNDDNLSKGNSQMSSADFSRAEGIDEELNFHWSEDMLTWQRTAYHFQPKKNWMNDPNGPLFYKGWYHFFYQYNPYSPLWGNMTWGHAVSRDLMNWNHLPYAMVPDQWYDTNGVFSGSATTLPDGRIMMLYTGVTKDNGQVQCLAYPSNLSDPLLLEWVKDPNNPVVNPTLGIDVENFRDPTTSWLAPDGDTWRLTIGSMVNKLGFSVVYETKDFVKYELLEGYLHEASGSGMWECVDFYPVALTGENGLDTSANGPNLKHVMKVSLFDDGNDYYVLGTYDPTHNKWIPDDSKMDVGIGLRYDYGRYYASKTFYDPIKQRRILWAWTKESHGEDIDILKGWSGLQTIPRTIVFDTKTGINIIQWPIEEVESLRYEGHEFNNVKLEPGSIVPLKINSASQLDIVATFEVEKEAFEMTTDETDIGYNCSSSDGGAGRGRLGPFGIVVLADEELLELTPIYFYIAEGINKKAETHFCADGLRSSEAPNVEKSIYGSKVHVLDGEKLSIRLLVDHSIVESFAQGGRTVITSRVYPTNAINGATRVFLFNNATGASVTASVKIWRMDSASFHDFPLDEM